HAGAERLQGRLLSTLRRLGAGGPGDEDPATDVARALSHSRCRLTAGPVVRHGQVPLFCVVHHRRYRGGRPLALGCENETLASCRPGRTVTCNFSDSCLLGRLLLWHAAYGPVMVNRRRPILVCSTRCMHCYFANWLC